MGDTPVTAVKADTTFKDGEEEKPAPKPALEAAVQVAFAPPAPPNDGGPQAPKGGDKAAKAADGGDKQKDVPEPLTGERLEASRRVQDMLIKYAYLFVSIDPVKDEKPEDAAKRYEKALTDKVAALEKEKKDGVFGDNSLDGYKQFVLKMQELVPGAVGELSRMQIPIPPGCPIDVPRDKFNMLLQPELFRKMVANGEIACDLGIDTKVAPDYQALNKLEAVLKFQGQCTAWSKEAHDKLVDDGLVHLIKQNGLPEAWAKRDGVDPEAWRASCKQMVEFAINYRNLVEAGYQLKQTDKYSNFNFELPPGITVKDGKPVFPPDMLPQDLRLSHPRNQELIAKMEAWMEKYGADIIKKHEEVNKSALHTWADQPFGENVQVVFDKDDNFVGIFPNTYKPDAAKGEKALPGNCFKHRYDVEEVNGEIKVKQTLQVQRVPAMGWQDWIAFDVGKEFVTENTYKKGQMVRINDSGKMMMVKADDLQWFKNVQAGWYYGTKIVMTALDVALLLTGFAEVSAGIKAASIAARSAQIAAATGKAAFSFTTREAMMQIGRGTVRATVGFLGVFNNAWGHTNDIGKAINFARHAYFMFDITRSLIPGRVAAVMPATRFSEFAKVGQKFDEAMKQTGFLWGAPKYLHGSFRVSEWAMLPLLGKDGIRAFSGPIVPHMDYANQLIEGTHLVNMPHAKPDLKKPDQLAAMRGTMDSWGTLLSENKPQAKKDEIKAIIDKTKELLDPTKHTDEERAAYRRELASKAIFSEKALQSMQEAVGRKLTQEELQNAVSRSRWDKLPVTLRWAVKQADAETDADVRAAANIALMYLSQKDGVIEGQLSAQAPITIGEHTWEESYESESGGGTIKRKVEGQTLEVSLSAADVAETLKHELAKAPEQLVSRGVAVADAMFRCGAITGPEFAAVLQDVLRCPTATKEQKMRALSDNGAPRYIDLIESMSRFEQMVAGGSAQDMQQATKLIGESSSANLRKTLEEMADKDADPDVRAMAAALLHGLREREASTALGLDIDALRRVAPNLMTDARVEQLKKLFATDKDIKASFLDQNNLLASAELAKGQGGKYAEEAKKALRAIMALQIPEDCPPEKAHLLRERKVSAALSYMMLDKTGSGRFEGSKAMADAIIDSPDLAVLRSEPANKHLYNRYLDLCVRVSQQMTPEMMRAMPDDKAKQLRAKLIEVLNTPASADAAEGQAMADIVRSLRTMMKDDPDKQALVAKLQGMIDPSKADKFAGAFPQLRAEAITTLASFGHRESLDLIRGRTAATPVLSLGDKNIPAGETDSRVRLAAVMALETLTDERLGEIAGRLVNTEKDVATLDKVRALMTRYQNPTVDAQAAYRRAYDEKYQETMSRLKRDFQYSVVDRMSNEQVKDWLKSKSALSLLNYENWTSDRSARAEQIRKDWNCITYIFRSAKSIHDYMMDGTKASDNERDEVWKKFARLARGSTEDVDPAGLMPAVDVDQLKRALLGDVEAEIAANKKRSKDNDDVTKSSQERIAALRKEITDAQTTLQNATRNMQPADPARQLLEKQNAEGTAQKQKEIDNLEKRIRDIQAEQVKLQEDLRKAEGVKRLIDKGINLQDGNTQKEIAAALAKRQAYLILMTGGGVDGTPDQKNPHWAEYGMPVYTDTTTTKQWQIAAANVLADCLKDGALGRSQAAEYVKRALTGGEIPAEARTILLNAWRDLAKVGGDKLREQLSLTEEEVGAVTLKALEWELSRAEGEQSKDYQKALLNDLLAYRYRPAFAVLEGMADAGKLSKCDKEVRELAMSVVEQLRDGVYGLWDRTIADGASTGAVRGQRMQERWDAYNKLIDPNSPLRRGSWVDTELAADQVVQSVFNNYKDYKFKTAAEMAPVMQLLDSPHDKIRLAAAKVLLQGSAATPDAGAARQKALLTLSGIAIDGKQAQYRRDAKSELNAFAADKSPSAKAEEWKGNRCEIELPTTDGTKKVISIQRVGEGRVAIVETTNSAITAAVDGLGRSRRFGRENGIINVMIDNGTHYARQKDQRGQYTREWIIDGDPKKRFHGEADVTADGVYSWWSVNGKETNVFTLAGNYSAIALERANGQIVAIQYPDVRDPEDVVRRTFKRDGEEITEMTYYRKGNPHPITATRQKGNDGKWADSWVITCHIGSNAAGWTPTTRGPWGGKMSLDDKGNYRFDGNGYNESQSAEGKFHSSSASSGGSDDFVNDG